MVVTNKKAAGEGEVIARGVGGAVSVLGDVRRGEDAPRLQVWPPTWGRREWWVAADASAAPIPFESDWQARRCWRF